jgi:hypothetical protein
MLECHAPADTTCPNPSVCNVVGCLFGKSKLPLIEVQEVQGGAMFDSILMKVAAPVMESAGFSYDPAIPQLDITAPEHEVQIESDSATGVLYVHVGPVTVLRICRIKNATFKLTGWHTERVTEEEPT